MLDNTPNQGTKFTIKNWIEVNDDAREMYNNNSKFKFKALMLNSSVCANSDAYILLKGTRLIAAHAENNQNNGNKKVVSKFCASFTDYKSEINNTEIDMLNTLIWL